MAKLADATLGCKTRCRKLLCTDPGHGIGDVMVPADGSKGPAAESIESCAQVLQITPRFSTMIKEDRKDGNIVDAKLGA